MVRVCGPPHMTERDIHPHKARRDFLKAKAQSVKEAAARTYEYPTKHFVNYLSNRGIESMNHIDGYLLEQWKLERKDEDIVPITLHNNVKHLRVFIRWCESSEIVKEGLANKMQIPDVTETETVSKESVSHERMDDLLTYLEHYEYATRQHALFKFLWHAGCRISGAMALDLEDFRPQENHVRFRNRPKKGTPLKNNNKSERNITLNAEIIGLLNDYIDARRRDITDEHGREPLFTTTQQRLTRQRAYKNFVALTRPCITDSGCPHDRAIDECEAAQNKRKATGCPSSTSLHPIRRGSITYHLTQGWPKEEVSSRCDVSVEVLEKHYDARTKEDKREQRSEFVDNL